MSDARAVERRALQRALGVWKRLATQCCHTHRSPDDAAREARARVEAVCFAALCRVRDLDPAWFAAGAGEGLPELALADWAALPIEFLGHLHQQLLDCRLEIADAGPRAQRSRQGRKASGVFYTPPAVAAYMAQQALGGPGSAQAGTTILDPACGCGGLLLAAAEVLLGDGRSSRDRVQQVAAALYGMDADAQAIQLARRAVWLYLMGRAGTTEPSAHLGPELATTLSRQIVAGDVLAESGGASFPTSFDVILGNPPYQRELGHRAQRQSLAQSPLGRRIARPRMDLWYYFVHRGLELLKPGGRLTFIVPAYWAAARGADRLRAALRDDVQLIELVLLDRRSVFRQAAGRHMILTLANQPPATATRVRRDPGTAALSDARQIAALPSFLKPSSELFRDGHLDLEPPCAELLARLETWPPLATLGMLRQGIVENPATVTGGMLRRHGPRWQPGEGVFVLSGVAVEALGLSPAERALLRPYHDTGEVGRYRLAAAPPQSLIYATAETWPRLEDFPGLAAHLARFRPLLEARRETRAGRRAWWHLHWPRAEAHWRSPKIIALQMAARPACVAALGPAYVPFSMNVFLPAPGLREHLHYLAALLNSRLLWKWFRHRAKRRGVGLEINGHVLAAAPIRRINWDDAADVARHDELAQRAAELTAADACRTAAAASAPRQRELADLERQVDQLVYQLYRLADAEIATVEAATATPEE